MAGHDVRVGIIGVGVMGADHAERVALRTAGARLTAVSDPDMGRATELASRYDSVRAIDDPLQLVADADVDAVLIASPGSVHEEQVLACIDHGKPTLCEKPLTMDSESSVRVLAAEREAGRRLVQVGFMRRFDPEYAELRSIIESNRLGRLLLLHQTHRNKTVPNADFRSEMIVRDSLVHEVDSARFLLDDEIIAIQVMSPSPSSYAADGVVDPQVSIFHMAGGGVVTNEVFVNCQVGYEVRVEAVAERGTVVAGRPQSGLYATVAGEASGTWGGAIAPDFTVRFAAAYDNEVQRWVDAAAQGEVVGADAWDGYAATAVCTAGMESLRTGEKVSVTLVDKETLS